MDFRWWQSVLPSPHRPLPPPPPGPPAAALPWPGSHPPPVHSLAQRSFCTVCLQSNGQVQCLLIPGALSTLARCSLVQPSCASFDAGRRRENNDSVQPGDPSRSRADERADHLDGPGAQPQRCLQAEVQQGPNAHQRLQQPLRNGATHQLGSQPRLFTCRADFRCTLGKAAAIDAMSLHAGNRSHTRRQQCRGTRWLRWRLSERVSQRHSRHR